MHHTIKETKESVWIGNKRRADQRFGRSYQEGSEDVEYGGTKDFLTNMMELNIVPVAISYEYDPCDFLKAQEFQQNATIPILLRVSATIYWPWKQVFFTIRACAFYTGLTHKQGTGLLIGEWIKVN